ncbi:MAG: sigma-70 family RNA polymerase sigma factor [Chloroflexota bacterium]
MGADPRVDAAIDALVPAAVAGDSGAFADLYDALAPRVRRYLRHEVGDPDLAEDLLQRVFLRVVEALPRYRPRGAPIAAWIFRIARNAVIDHRRTAHPGLPLDDAAETPADVDDPCAAAERGEECAQVRAALRALPPDQRDVLVWRFFAELSPAETAVLMDRSNGAVRVLQHRALAALRAFLGEPASTTVSGR